MNEWKEYLFEEIIDSMQLGTSALGGEDNFGIPLLKMGNLRIGGFDFEKLERLKEVDYKFLAPFILKKGDFLFNTRNTLELVGKSSVWNNQLAIATFNSNIMRIKFKKEVDDFYLGFYFSNGVGWNEFKRVATGTTSVAAIYSRDLLRCKVFLPDYKSQVKISDILTTTDAVIEKTQAAVAKYKAIKQGMLHDLFTRGIDIKTGKLRLKYEDAPELYKESMVGMVPREWEVKPLEELTTQIGDGIHTTPKYSENTDYYFINGNNLSDGQILIGSALCVSEDEYKKHFKELSNRTILYSINGTIGNIAIYKHQKVILGKSACYISCKQNVNLDYIFFILQSFPIQKFYELEMTGSTIKNLSLASVRNTPIAVPNDDKEQDLIAERIRTINNKLQTEQNYLHKLQQIKAGLMGDLLSGRKSLYQN